MTIIEAVLTFQKLRRASWEKGLYVELFQNEYLVMTFDDPSSGAGPYIPKREDLLANDWEEFK